MKSLLRWRCILKRNVLLMLTTLILAVTISLNGCALIKAVSSFISPSHNSGTSVRGNTLHAGPQTNKVGTTGYRNVGEVNYHQVKQTGDYILRIIGLIGLFALLAFITFRFFRFLKRLIELEHRSRKE